MLGMERRQKIMKKPQPEQKLYVSELRKGITDNTDTQIGVDFCPIKDTNRTHSKGYVEDLSTQCGQKRCAKMAWLNLSVLP